MFRLYICFHVLNVLFACVFSNTVTVSWLVQIKVTLYQPLTCDFIYASNLLPLLPTPLPYNNNNVRMHYALINAALSAHITHWYTGLNTIFCTHVEADSPIKTIYTYDKALYGNTHTRSCTHALWHVHTVTVAETWQLILVGAERLWGRFSVWL